MVQQKYFTAVVDFGKTNKKVLLYDQDLKVCAVRKKTFVEVERDGYRCDDLDGAMQFVFEALKTLAQEFSPIRAIAFTTYGATFLCLDADGELAFPSVSYDMTPPPGLRDRFYREFGSAKALQAETMTPPLPLLINPGFGLYFLKHHDPERFSRVARILFLPQYLGYVLTGRMALDPTYAGCHTYLWDFGKNGPSRVAEGMGVAGMLGESLQHPWEVQGMLKPDLAAALGLPGDCRVTCGIHDSNASLLPYILKESADDFVLNSTGTWCVAMSPGGAFPLADSELGKEVFFNLSAFGKPVKTTIFRGGAEFAFWCDKLGQGHEHDDQFARDAMARVMQEGAFVLPPLFPGSGMFPDSRASVIRADLLLESPALAFAAIDLSLAIQSKTAICATTARQDPAVFIEGGFRNNKPYMAVLSSLFPDSQVFLSDFEEATAFGAAITAKCAVEECAPADVADAFVIDTTPLSGQVMDGLDDYVAEFHRLTEGLAGK